MKLLEEIILPNGLKLIISDVSRPIAADTVKIEVDFKIDIDLKESFFENEADYQDLIRSENESDPALEALNRHQAEGERLDEEDIILIFLLFH